MQVQGQAQAAQALGQAQELGLTWTAQTWTSWEGLAGSHVHGQEQEQGQVQAAQEQGLTWTSWEGLAGSHVHGQEQEQGLT